MNSPTKQRSTRRVLRSFVPIAAAVFSLSTGCARASTGAPSAATAPPEDARALADASRPDSGGDALVIVRGAALDTPRFHARLLVVATDPTDVGNLWKRRVALAFEGAAPRLLGDDYRAAFLSAFSLGDRVIVVTRTLDDSHVECCHGADHPDALDPPLTYALFVIDARSSARRLEVSSSLATDPLASRSRSGELRFFAADERTIVVRDARGVDRALDVDWERGSVVGVRVLRRRAQSAPTLALRAIEGVEPLAFEGQNGAP